MTAGRAADPATLPVKDFMRLISCCVILLQLLIAGCVGGGSSSPIPPGQIDLFGVALHSSVDYREIMGVRGNDEPCLRGFERTFEPLEIVLGYGRDGRIRKITTRNPQTSIFGVHPGEAVDSALIKVRGAGFVETDSPYRFRRGDLGLALLVDGNGRAFGLTLEVSPPG